MLPTLMNDLIARLCASPGSSRLPPRVLVVAAHPADETIGLGARLPWLDRWVTVLHVTDGPRPGGDDDDDAAAAALRRRELASAMALAGVQPDQLARLDYPHGGVSFHLVKLARRLADLFRQRQPALVITHGYEGCDPDHDAVAFAVHAARQLLGVAAPPLVEMTSYPTILAGLEPSTFVPAYEPITAVPLAPPDADLKRRMLDCFASQREALAQVPLEVEQFRPAPAYDFLRPPHPGPMIGGPFGAGVDGARFRNLARTALFALRGS